MPCTTVSVEDPTPDSSRLVLDPPVPRSAEPGGYRVEVPYRNVIENGEGESLSQTVRVTVDGREVTRETISTSPGDSGSFMVEGVAEAGDRRVCVEEV